MPIHLPPTTRRGFLNVLAAGGAALAWPGARSAVAAGREEDAADYVALLADTHIKSDPDMVVREKFHLSGNLRAAVADILAQPRPPAAALVLGDLALKNGRAEDYRQFLTLVEPLRERGIPVHLTLGNHDDRRNFLESFAALGAAVGPVEDRCVGVVEAAGVRLAMLDTLDQVDQVPGLLGDSQRAWLTKTLDEAPDAPTLVLFHHHLDDVPGALTDAKPLLEILRPRKQVKALVFGHTHTWRRAEDDGLHLVNLPAVAYHFNDPQPLGWCRLEPHRDGQGATLELRCVDGDRSKHGERIELAWRGA
ncbi:metallophosphoesterase family protein [Planctomyces sp. SH-PL62]|uniref:metallophosphoesterase family protein n=1 Tax=Planctomyces sp. SH-PL62 TaxID=1636152 RepID=UPI00078D721D|nr:metallophosphoesterase [Planctomyces sp. SH-PL62]AMV37503.1 3',5'-cyclic adenosine monophosphate phosphodiesterase CpdA [Planctomyces sp. SH-PL62]